MFSDCEDCEVDNSYGMCPCKYRKVPALGETNESDILAQLTAKLDALEQATDRLNEQNSSMRLERTELQDWNEVTRRECSELETELQADESAEEQQAQYALQQRAAPIGGDPPLGRNGSDVEMVRRNEREAQFFAATMPANISRSAHLPALRSMEHKQVALENEIAMLEQKMARLVSTSARPLSART